MLQPQNRSLTFYKYGALIVTFFAYASFHASRKPASIVKSVLGPAEVDGRLNDTTGWPPFNGPDGTRRLGELDLAFLTLYAFGMYCAGHVGDRIDLKKFLVFGMMGSGFLTAAFGFGYWFSVHSLWYYIAVQMLCGLFQSIGWPCVVAVVGNWFGRDENRGFIMGAWNSHTSVGNIVGSVLASTVLEFGWGWSFVVPGVLVIVVGVFVFLFLVVRPEDLGFEAPGRRVENLEMQVGHEERTENEEVGLLGVEKSSDSSEAIGFFQAWRLPGVLPFSLCLFCSKMVAYTFLYWLPFYIRHTAVAGVHLSHKTAGILSTIFDLGGVLGGILAGWISDMFEARAATSVGFLFFSIPALILYRAYGSLSMVSNIVLMFLSGLLVNGPYSLITTAVAADLGTQDRIRGNSRALATVTAIIDGTGSIGAALGPLLAGYISTRGWDSVFVMLVVANTSAALILVCLAKTEIQRIRSRRHHNDAEICQL